MRPVLTILAAIALAALAVNSFMHQQWLGGTAFLAGALVLVLPALCGEGLGDLGDADLMISFVKNPFGTIVDETIERVSQGGIELPQMTSSKEQAPAAFDPDAALQRYMERRDAAGAETFAPPAPAAPPAPVRTFGRKQA